jgi:23S rRNA (uracil1939-C5)-methyltransferase
MTLFFPFWEELFFIGNHYLAGKCQAIACKHYICEKKVARKKAKPFYEKIRIENIGAEGKALARIDDLVVFTKYVVPGDVVDLQVIRKRKNYQEAVVTKIHEFSKDRTEAFCTHFGICGGCKWQFLPYSKQLDYKQKQVEDQLKRIGKVNMPAVAPIIASQNDTYYRNKLEFTFSNKRWLSEEEISSENEIENTNALGFHIPGLFDKVINIEKCWLQPSPSNEIRNFICRHATENGLSFFDIRQKEGLLRTLIIRTSSTGETMVILSFFKNESLAIANLMQAIKNKFPEITSLLYVINSKGNDTITDQHVEVFSGRDCIFEEMEGLKFKIGPKSFFQTNTLQAYQLYKITREFARLTGNEIVYDLYTGTGTIANFVARNAKKVIGIEYVPEAISDANINASLNNISNTSFFAGDMKDILNSEFIGVHGHPDVIITDPPRAGMHTDVVNNILSILPNRVVYVSCNPATQARDISLLSNHFKITAIQPFDMFPHTHHVENVVLLERI